MLLVQSHRAVHMAGPGLTPTQTPELTLAHKPVLTWRMRHRGPKEGGKGSGWCHPGPVWYVALPYAVLSRMTNSVLSCQVEAGETQPSTPPSAEGPRCSSDVVMFPRVGLLRSIIAGKRGRKKFHILFFDQQVWKL